MLRITDFSGNWGHLHSLWTFTSCYHIHLYTSPSNPASPQTGVKIKCEKKMTTKMQKDTLGWSSFPLSGKVRIEKSVWKTACLLCLAFLGVTSLGLPVWMWHGHAVWPWESLLNSPSCKNLQNVRSIARLSDASSTFPYPSVRESAERVYENVRQLSEESGPQVQCILTLGNLWSCTLE